MRRVWLLVLTLLSAACSSESSATSGSNGVEDAGSEQPVSDAGTDVIPDATAPEAEAEAGTSCDDKAKGCASTFGSLFTKSDGRADGTLVALVRPSDTGCAMPNSTHVVLQLSIQNQVQRLVTSVDGVAVLTKTAPLLGPPYAEGWHENVLLEYATDLGVHSTDFTPVSLNDAVGFICSHLTIGAPVSVYAYSDGTEPSSAHQIHSNDGYPDGAIVVDPTSQNPTYLLFRYLDQVF